MKKNKTEDTKFDPATFKLSVDKQGMLGMEIVGKRKAIMAMLCFNIMKDEDVRNVILGALVGAAVISAKQAKDKGANEEDLEQVLKDMREEKAKTTRNTPRRAD